MELWQKWEYKNCERYENVKIQNDMRMYKLWMIWECKNDEWYENVKIVNDMRM